MAVVIAICCGAGATLCRRRRINRARRLARLRTQQGMVVVWLVMYLQAPIEQGYLGLRLVYHLKYLKSSSDLKLVILSTEKTMVTKVISELKSIFRLKIQKLDPG